MPGPRLLGKVAIITGAGTGIGEAIAHKFAYEGAKVVINGLPGDPVQDVANTINERGGHAVAVEADVAEHDGAHKCVEAAISNFGQLDILISNAGYITPLNEIDKFSDEEFDRLLRANTRSAFLMTKHAIPHLHKTLGNIVYTGSEAGFNGTPMFTPYGGTKAFLHAFCKGVAVEQAKYGIRANCVCPGAIDSAWTFSSTGTMDKKSEQTFLGSTPLGRRGTTEEMANVFAFLASDEARFVTGALWLADGGITPAHGLPGDEVKTKLEPKDVLELEHKRDGLKNKPSYPKIEGKDGK